MNRLINSRYGLLIFSLLSGIAYFTLVMILISQIKYSYLLGIFFCPAVVCGAAVCIIKSVKSFVDNAQIEKARRIVGIHTALIIFSIIFAIVLALA